MALHLAVLRTFGELNGGPPVGVTLFVEGEEESGSPTFPTLLAEQGDRLAANVIIIADSTNPATDVLLPSARAAVNLRLAPGQDLAAARHALHDHLMSHVPWGAQATVTFRMAAEPVRLETGGAVYDAARHALTRAYGHPPVTRGAGGSAPFITEFARTFHDTAMLITGLADPASRMHGIDESLDPAMFARAVRAEAVLLAELSR